MKTIDEQRRLDERRRADSARDAQSYLENKVAGLQSRVESLEIALLHVRERLDAVENGAPLRRSWWRR